MTAATAALAQTLATALADLAKRSATIAKAWAERSVAAGGNLSFARLYCWIAKPISLQLFKQVLRCALRRAA